MRLVILLLILASCTNKNPDMELKSPCSSIDAENSPCLKRIPKNQIV